MDKRVKLRLFISAVTLLAWVLMMSLSFAQEVSPQPTPAPAEQAAPAAPKVEPGKVPVPFTQELLDQLGGAKVAMDTVWTLMTAFLVFFMNLGFAILESGFCRAKNVVTVLAKNFIVFAVSSLAFLIIGFGIMFGDGTPFFGTQGLWFVGGADNSPAMADAYTIKESIRPLTGLAPLSGPSFSSSSSLLELLLLSFLGQ